eukprot:g4405.t1
MAQTAWPTRQHDLSGSGHQCRYEDTYLSTTADSDSDGIYDCQELSDGTYADDGTTGGGTDTDGDGYNDDVDVFPNDPTEWADTDGDGVGDNEDAFPNEATETIDTDSDGIGNNADTDDDGDGFSDADETNVLVGTDPLDAGSVPSDLDTDFIPDAIDTDRDGDGIDNGSDAFPDNPAETTDTDGDGTGDNADAFPNDPTETIDTDSDGLGDNREASEGTNPNLPDTDSDGLTDGQEVFTYGTNPLNADTDDDGTNDGDEIANGTDPLVSDLGFPPTIELTISSPANAAGWHNTDVTHDLSGSGHQCRYEDTYLSTTADSDSDGIYDCQELSDGTYADDGTTGGGTDTDGDGYNDDVDVFPNDPTEWADTDGDGVGDNEDAFPNEATETIDTDSDGIGNNADTDDDGDGFSDADETNVLVGTDPLDAGSVPSDLDTDFIPDAIDTDRDGDGIDNGSDAFPDNPAETTDTDGDGTGDNADAFPNDPTETIDTDSDGLGDNREASEGTNPNLPDTDSDGLTDGQEVFTYGTNPLNADTDDDGTNDGNLTAQSISFDIDLDTDADGISDSNDAFPGDPSEWSDLDGDGEGDNMDLDRDGDGISNDYELAVDTDADDGTDVPLDTDLDGVPDAVDDDRDGDGVANSEDHFPDDPTASSVPTVAILSPSNLTTVGVSPVTVTGTVDDLDARLTINGVEVIHNGTFSADVALEEGANTIIVRASDELDHEGLATLQVSLDLTPPTITFESHTDGQTVYTDTVTITGLVNDIVRGTVSEDEAVVTVNGLSASVANRSYSAESIPLVSGNNLISVSATDAVGNVSTSSIQLTYEAPQNNLVEVVSGQGQSAGILEPLTDPLRVRLTTNGVPDENKPVVFRVVDGDGMLQPGTADESQGAVVYTDSNGEAEVQFRLGSRAGLGSNRVRARAVGYDGEAVFNAESNYGAVAIVGIIDGNNQRGSILQPLASPFIVAVTDTGANLVPGAEVEFTASTGSGKFANGEQTYLTTTDMDGRASAQFILGSETGLGVQRVTANLVASDSIAVFTASAFVPGDPGDTAISGVILDNQDNPMPSVIVSIEGSSRTATSDDQGRFTISNAPVGAVHLLVDPSTTTRLGEWSELSYNLVTVPGVDNPLPAPIYMVEIDVDNAIFVGDEDVVITHPDIPGMEIFVEAGSVTFPDGTNEGLLGVTAVNANKVPMAPPNGMQPQLIMTLQPHGAIFDPPARVTLPNVDGHSPGAEVEMYSYDHDLEEFVTIGLGTCCFRPDRKGGMGW